MLFRSDQGFGGALVDLKNKVLKECDDFFTWREDTLGGGSDEPEFWNTEESDDQGWLEFIDFLVWQFLY